MRFFFFFVCYFSLTLALGRLGHQAKVVAEAMLSNTPFLFFFFLVATALSAKKQLLPHFYSLNLRLLSLCDHFFFLSFE